MYKMTDKVLYFKPVTEVLTILKPSISSCLYKNNRPIDETRVENMYQKQLELYKMNGEYGYNGTPLHIAMLSNQVYILDGQHRLSMLERLQRFRSGTLTNDFMAILYVHTCKSEDDMKRKFLEINDNFEPVPRLYKDDDLKFIVNDVIDHIKSNYSAKSFSKSRNCRRPFTNLSVLAEKLSMCDNVREYCRLSNDNKYTINTIISAIERYNRKLSYSDRSTFYKTDTSQEIKTVNNAHLKLSKLPKPFMAGITGSNDWISSLSFSKLTLKMKKKDSNS